MKAQDLSEVPLDAGIARAVHIVNEANVFTYESCEGGEGHAFPEPTVRFSGNRSEAFRALAALLDYGLRVFEMRHVWRIEDGDLTGPSWDIVFIDKLEPPDAAFAEQLEHDRIMRAESITPTGETQR